MSIPAQCQTLCCPSVAVNAHCRRSRRVGVSLHLVGAAVQLDLEGLEMRPVGRLGAPTLQHGAIEKVGTFGRSWHPVAFGHLLVHFLIAEGWGAEMERERKCEEQK